LGALLALGAGPSLAAPVAVASPPANDAYPGVTIDSLPYTAAGSTVEATGEAGEPNPGDVSVRAVCFDSVTPDSGCLRSVWFSLPPGPDDTGEPLTVETCGSTFDTVLASYTTYGDLVPPLGSLNFPAWSDDAYGSCGENQESSAVYIWSFAGAWQRLVINGFEADAGDYVLHVYRGPNTSISINTSEPEGGGYAIPMPVLISSSSAATFECSLDGSAFASCVSLLGQPVSSDPFNLYFDLDVGPGPHTLAARARDTDGYVDPYPAVRSWTSLAPPAHPPPTPPRLSLVPSGPTPPPPTPLFPKPPADTTAPALQLGGATSQKGLRQRGVLVVAASPAEASTVSAKGKVSIRHSAKVFRLTPVTTQIAKGGKATLKLKLQKSALKAIGRALKAGKRVTAKLTVTAKDAAGNANTKQRTIKLKR
jgi:hypothetical protein